MSDRSNEPSGFARVFFPVLALLGGGALVAAWRSRRHAAQRAEWENLDSGPDGHPS